MITRLHRDGSFVGISSLNHDTKSITTEAVPNSSTGSPGVTSDSRLSPTAVTPQKPLRFVGLTRGGDDTTNGRKGFWRGDRRRSSMSAGSSTHAWHDLVGDGPAEARKSRFVVAGLRLKDPRWDWGNPRSRLTWRQVRPVTNAAMRCIPVLHLTGPPECSLPG